MKKVLSHIKVPSSVGTMRGKFNAYQKMFLIYFVILLLLLIFVPLIELSYLGSTQVDTFGIFNTYMSKSAVLISLIILFLIVYNSSPQRRYKLHQIFGFTHNSHLTNIVGLLMILISLFSIGDAVTLIKQNMSPRVSTTSGFLVIGIYIIIGLAISIMIARIEHKRSTKTTEVNVKTETDTTHLEPRFEQAKKEVDGLFGKEMT